MTTLSVVPSSNITELVGLKIIIQHSKNHYTFKIKMKKFLKLKMLRWKFNRPPNHDRAKEIAESLLHKQYPLSFIFQCIYNKQDHGLEIIDGLHRFHAIKYLESQLEDNELNEWFYNSNLLIEAKTNNTEGEVIDWFQSINKCSPVSDLYLNSQDEKKEIVEEVVNKYYSNPKYNSHFRGLNPNIPNTNKEKFTDLVCYIYETHEISLENKKNIYKLLDNINKLIEEKVKNDDPKKFNKKITQKSMEKCYKTGLFLFLSNEDEFKFLIRNYKFI